MTTKNESDQPRTLDDAVAACEANIARHRSLAVWAMISGVLLLLAIVLFAAYYANIVGETRDTERLELLSYLEIKQQALGFSARSYSDDAGWRRVTNERAKLRKSKPTDGSPEDAVRQWQSSVDALEKEAEAIGKTLDEENERRVAAAQAEVDAAQEALHKKDSVPLISSELMFTVVALSAVVVGVFTALYRFHQKEMAKNEHYKLGFLRIRIAATNSDREGFKDEVRTALTLNAFSMPSDGIFDRKEKRLDSPLPGHPAAELMTGLINKLLEQFDVILQPKK